jgi:hypothetical protein
MVREMWGGDILPVTEPVDFTMDGNWLFMSCKTAGSSIALRYKGEGDPDQWFLYTEPVELSPQMSIEALANRIGYVDSEIRYFECRVNDSGIN